MAQGSQDIIGTEGDDVIEVKGNSDDTISGLGGNDVINGGAGFDVIDGGDGNDTLTGGAHDDTFVFTGTTFGNDVVTDFKTGDVIDLSGTGITDLTGLVTNDANGNAVISDGNGNTITLDKVSAETFLADPNNFILATGPEEIFLGVDDTYTDAGDGTDQIIDGDSAGEGLTDTDTFIFVRGTAGTGDDTINDFQTEDFDFNTGQTIVGDTLDLTDFGIFGQDFFQDPVTEAVAAYDALIDITFLDANGNVLQKDDPGVDENAVTSIMHLDSDGDGVADGTITLLGVDFVEMQTLIEFNLVDVNGSTGGANA